MLSESVGNEEYAIAVVENSADAVSVSSEVAEAKAPAVAEVQALVPVLSEQRVELVNLDSSVPQYVPTLSGMVRIGPKTAEVIPASEVTDATRQAIVPGRIVIRNL